MQLESTVVQALSRLLDVKPEYDWTPLNWYVSPDLPDTVINKQPSSVIADLKGKRKHTKARFSTEMPKASLSDSLRVPKDGENLNLSPQS